MDDILRDSARDERRKLVRLGIFLVIMGGILTIGTYALTSGAMFLWPIGAIVYGLGCIGRGVAGRSLG
jgi:hypothetical protein